MSKPLPDHLRQIRRRGHGTAPKPCAHCGATFMARLADVDVGNGRFCSLKCKGLAMRRPATERFWTFVEKTESCWLFKPAVASNGYGRFTNDGRRYMKASRFSW